MALPATEDFSLTENPLATNWTTCIDFPGGLRSTGSGAFGAAGTADNGSYWDADVFADAQYSQGQMDNERGIGTRAPTGGAESLGYLAFKASNTEWKIFEISDGPTFTQLGSTLSVSTDDTDVMKFQSVDTSHELFKGGASQGSRTDVTVGSGSAWIHGYSTDSGLLLTDWEGGNVAPVGGIVVLRRRRM